MTKTIIETERLILRDWQATDIDPMTVISSDPDVMEFFPGLQDRTYTADLIQKLQSHCDTYGYTFFAIDLKATNEFIGFVGIYHTPFHVPIFDEINDDIIEIGWRIAKQHWNQGYATEAAKAVLDYAFNVQKLPVIVSFTAQPNKRSAHIMKKIGMQLYGRFMHPNLDPTNELCEHVLYTVSDVD